MSSAEITDKGMINLQTNKPLKKHLSLRQQLLTAYLYTVLTRNSFSFFPSPGENVSDSMQVTVLFWIMVANDSLSKQ